MDDLSIQEFPRCSECGADNSPQAVTCWLCGATIDGRAQSRDRHERPVDAEVVGSYAPPPPPPVVGTAYQFRLITLFLIVTVACLCLGLWHHAPGLTILLLIIALPALVRTAAASRRMTDGSRRVRLVDMVISFALSFALVILVFVAGVVAFCVACFAALAGFGTDRIQPVIWTAVAGGLLAFIVLMVATWPRRKRD